MFFWIFSFPCKRFRYRSCRIFPCALIFSGLFKQACPLSLTSVSMPRCFLKIVSTYLYFDHFWGFLLSVIKVGAVHCRLSIEFWEKVAWVLLCGLFLFWLLMLGNNRNISHYLVLECPWLVVSLRPSSLLSGVSNVEVFFERIGLQCMLFGVEHHVCYTWFNNFRTSIEYFCWECLKYGEVILRRGHAFG